MVDINIAIIGRVHVQSLVADVMCAVFSLQESAPATLLYFHRVLNMRSHVKITRYISSAVLHIYFITLVIFSAGFPFCSDKEVQWCRLSQDTLYCVYDVSVCILPQTGDTSAMLGSLPCTSSLTRPILESSPTHLHNPAISGLPSRRLHPPYRHSAGSPAVIHIPNTNTSSTPYTQIING